MRKILIAAAMAAGLSQPAGAVNLILNGSFELPNVGAGFIFDAPLVGGVNVMPNWTITQGTIDLTGINGIPAHSGLQAVDLIGSLSQNGGIVQSFAAISGQAYNLSFWYTHNFGANASSFSANATVSSANGVALSTNVAHNTFANVANPGWTLFSGNFIANAPLMTLAFVNLTGAFNGGIYLDTVSVEAVLPPGETPIPGALPLFATGLAAFGFAAYRRKNRKAVTQ